MQMHSKDSVAQNVLTHEALYRITPLLDQISQGLKKGGILRCIQMFPYEYAPLLVYTGELSATDVLEAIYVDDEETEVQEGDNITLAFLRRFVHDCDGDGKFDTYSVVNYLMPCHLHCVYLPSCPYQW